MTARRITLRVTAGIVLVLGLTLAFAAGAVWAYEAAKVTARIGLLLAALLIVFFGVSLLVVGLAAKLWQPTSRSLTVIASAGLTLLLLVALSVTILRPMQTPTLVPGSRANTRYWSLPTGSRIAYSLYEPPPGVPVRTGSVAANPINRTATAPSNIVLLTRYLPSVSAGSLGTCGMSTEVFSYALRLIPSQLSILLSRLLVSNPARHHKRTFLLTGADRSGRNLRSYRVQPGGRMPLGYIPASKSFRFTSC